MYFLIRRKMKKNRVKWRIYEYKEGFTEENKVAKKFYFIYYIEAE